jgi:hypothetical protein
MRHFPALLTLPVLIAAAVLPAPRAWGQKPPPVGFDTPRLPTTKPPPLDMPGARPGPGSGPGPLAVAPRDQGGGKPAPAGPGQGGPGPGQSERRAVSSGTGFVVAPGRLMTNHHVANGCAEMRARTSSGTDLPARLLVSDEQRDLALLEVRGETGPPLRFREAPAIRRGEGVVTYGFPLAGVLSSGPTLTTGDVSALAGLRDNPLQFQISAPVQPGNSGGPLLDLGGHVVGVVVSKLNAQRIAQATGDIPQNVNFAVKGNEALSFLRRNNVAVQTTSAEGPLLNAAEVGEIAHPSTLFLRCMR